MPGLAAAYVDPAAADPARAAITVAFDAYAGGVGLFAGLWTVLLGVALFRLGGSARILGVLGLVAAAGQLSTPPSVVGIGSPVLLTQSGIAWQLRTAAVVVWHLRALRGWPRPSRPPPCLGAVLHGLGKRLVATAVGPEALAVEQEVTPDAPARDAHRVFASVCGLGRDGRMPPRGLRDALALAALSHARGVHLDAVPLAQQRPPMALGAGLAPPTGVQPWSEGHRAAPPPGHAPPLLPACP